MSRPTHRSSRRHSATGFQIHAVTERSDFLLTLVDVGLYAPLVLVPMSLGGRLPMGHLSLTLGALWAAGCWILRQIVRADGRWSPSRTELLWLVGIVFTLFQMTPLPGSLLAAISPQQQNLLGPWQTGEFASIGLGPWSTLSLNPAGTATGLALFLGYALWFQIAYQRWQTQDDLDQALQRVLVIITTTAAFGLLQYVFDNGKFFWFFEHPQQTTSGCTHGPFICRNHFAEFLALGVGPFLWFWVRSNQSDSQAATTQQTGWQTPATGPSVRTGLAIAGLALVVLTALLTLSRGGSLAVGIAGFVTLLALLRTGQVSARFLLGLSACGLVMGIVFAMTSYESLARRVDVIDNQSRFEIWAANWKLFQQFPLSGTGIGTHAAAHQLVIDRGASRKIFTHAESCYMQIASETGSVGLVLLGATILLVLSWIVRVLWRSNDPRQTAFAAALLGSCVATGVHAVFDFIWYIPGCVVMLLPQLVMASRLSQLATRPAHTGWKMPKFVWLGTGGTVTAVGLWMLAIQLPALSAQPLNLRYQWLTYQAPQATEDEADEDYRLQQQVERAKTAVRAMKAQPESSTLQAIAAYQYLKMFDLKQSRSDLPMSLLQLRDTVQVSEFASVEEARAWLDNACGKNSRLLDAAWNAARKAVQESPLEGAAYLTLAELSFRYDTTGELREKLIQQALHVRPYHAEIRYTAGEEALLAGDEARAIELWRDVFAIGGSYPLRIGRVLAAVKPAEFFLTEFQPDYAACQQIYEVYQESGQTTEAAAMLQAVAVAAIAQARQSEDDVAARAWIAAADAYTKLGRPDAALQTLLAGADQLPHHWRLREALGKELYHQGQFVAAAEHLRWVSRHRPDDVGLRQLAEDAHRESLKDYRATSSQVLPANYVR